MATKTEFTKMTNKEAEAFLKNGAYDTENMRRRLIQQFPSLRGIAESLYPNDMYDKIPDDAFNFKPMKPDKPRVDRFSENILREGIQDVLANQPQRLSIEAFKIYISDIQKRVSPDRYKFWIDMAQQAVDMYRLDIRNDCLPILLKRHIMYGKGSLVHTGTLGIAVRCIDKLARIQNMEAQDIDDHEDSIRDSQVDIFNYCVLAYLLITVDGVE